MKTFTSLDLQQNTGAIQRAATVEPVLITSHGRPRLVVCDVDEYARLKRSSGETVPAALHQERKATTIRNRAPDPFGYDTGDFEACARAMIAAVESGRNRTAVAAEIAAVEDRIRRIAV